MKPVIHPGTAARSSRAGRRVLSLLFVLLLLPLTVSAAELPESLVPLGIPAGTPKSPNLLPLAFGEATTIAASASRAARVKVTPPTVPPRTE